MYKKLILICGMPRSGTSWLGQIFDSSPSVVFRMEPLFSFKFKNIINDFSSKKEIIKFFEDVYETNDDFILQKENREKGVYYSYKKYKSPKFLVIKTTRHHSLLERYLMLIDNIEIISIVRNPCAVLNSWTKTEQEFSRKGCKIINDWRTGTCRKDGYGEYWGFDDWLSVTKQHVVLSHKYSNFRIIKYSRLLNSSENLIDALFNQLSIPYTAQTIDFLRNCNRKHDNDPYSVFKSTDVEMRWKNELDKSISCVIVRDTLASGLGGFLD